MTGALLARTRIVVAVNFLAEQRPVIALIPTAPCSIPVIVEGLSAPFPRKNCLASSSDARISQQCRIIAERGERSRRYKQTVCHAPRVGAGYQTGAFQLLRAFTGCVIVAFALWRRPGRRPR